MQIENRAFSKLLSILSCHFIKVAKQYFLLISCLITVITTEATVAQTQVNVSLSLIELVYGDTHLSLSQLAWYMRCRN
jgi:hypothetical protein